MREQEFHLVGKNAAIGQDQVLGQIRRVRHRQQAHIGLLRRAVVLALVAVPAGGHAVLPGRGPAARGRHHMITRQQMLRKLLAAVQAEIAISLEQRAIGQQRDPAHVAPGAVGNSDDRADLETRLLAGGGIDAAADQEALIPGFPAHAPARVEGYRYVPVNPGNRYTAGVHFEDGRDVVHHHKFRIRSPRCTQALTSNTKNMTATGT